MSNSFNPMLWFVCRICRQAFPHVDRLNEHKIQNHLEECDSIKCIIFEERFLDQNQLWHPGDIIPKEEPNLHTDSYNNETSNCSEFAKVETNSNCSVPDKHDNMVAVASPSKRFKASSWSNPYVQLKRLSAQELEAPSNEESSSSNQLLTISSSSPTVTRVLQPTNPEELNVLVGVECFQNSVTLPAAKSSHVNELEGITTTPEIIRIQIPADDEEFKVDFDENAKQDSQEQELEDGKFIVASFVTNSDGVEKIHFLSTSTIPYNPNLEATTTTISDEDGKSRSPVAGVNDNVNDHIDVEITDTDSEINIVLESKANKLVSSSRKKAENDVCYGKRKRTTRSGYKNISSDSESDVFVIESEDDYDDSDEDYEYYEERNFLSKAKRRNTSKKQGNSASALKSTSKPETKSKSKNQSSKTKSKPKRDSTLELVTNPKLKSNDILATTTLEVEDEGYFHSLSLIEWLKTQAKDQSQIFDSNVTLPRNLVLLDPDLTSESTTLKASEISVSNPVTCRLCLVKLESETDVRNHAENCWFHNKKNHLLCLKCDDYFENHDKLSWHNKTRHRDREEHQQDQNPNQNAKPKAKRSKSSVSCIICRKIFPDSCSLKFHKQSLTIFNRRIEEIEKNIKCKKSKDTPLYYWLKVRRQILCPDGTENVILIDPEPKEGQMVDIISEACPITCLLCSKELYCLRGVQIHVSNCWFKNKGTHRYCVPCKKGFVSAKELHLHKETEHSKKDDGRAEKVGDEYFNVYFKCKFCKKEFYDKNTFLEHEKSHDDDDNAPMCTTSDSKTFDCQICGKKFALQGYLFGHMKTHLKDRPFKCQHCSKQFVTNGRLENHLLTHGKVTKRQCRYCCKSFDSNNCLAVHERIHSGDRPFKCSVGSCTRRFASNSAIQNHNRKEHRKELGLPDILCPTCGKTFGSQSSLDKHILVHHTSDRPFKCSHEGCTSTWKFKYQLIQHEREHTGEKPFQCEECGMAFAQNFTFKKHQKKHQGSLRRIQCHLCPLRFAGTWELNNHLKLHEEGKTKKFQCRFCGLGYSVKSHLKKHERSHDEAKNTKLESDTESGSESEDENWSEESEGESSSASGNESWRESNDEIGSDIGKEEPESTQSTDAIDIDADGKKE